MNQSVKFSSIVILFVILAYNIFPQQGIKINLIANFTDNRNCTTTSVNIGNTLSNDLYYARIYINAPGKCITDNTAALIINGRLSKELTFLRSYAGTIKIKIYRNNPDTNINAKQLNIIPGDPNVFIGEQFFRISYIYNLTNKDKKELYLSAEGRIVTTGENYAEKFIIETGPVRPEFKILSTGGKTITKQPAIPAPAEYYNDFDVELTTVTNNAIIAYTIGTDDPPAGQFINGEFNVTTGELYTGKFRIDGNHPNSDRVKINAIAFKDGMAESEVAMREYRLKVKKPEIGTVTENNIKKVVMTSETEDTQFLFIIDGEEPEEGIVYSEPFPIPETGEILKVMGIKAKYENSIVINGFLDNLR